jgi:hypothetical protein
LRVGLGAPVAIDDRRGLAVGRRGRAAWSRQGLALDIAAGDAGALFGELISAGRRGVMAWGGTQIRRQIVVVVIRHGRGGCAIGRISLHICGRIIALGVGLSLRGTTKKTEHRQAKGRPQHHFLFPDHRGPHRPIYAEEMGQDEGTRIARPLPGIL